MLASDLHMWAKTHKLSLSPTCVCMGGGRVKRTLSSPWSQPDSFTELLNSSARLTIEAEHVASGNPGSGEWVYWSPKGLKMSQTQQK